MGRHGFTTGGRRSRPGVGGAIALAAAVVLAGCAGDASPGDADRAGHRPVAVDPASDGLVVRTDKGPVRGTETGSVHSFVGVPFAAPPVGPLRWRPPQPAASWDEPLAAPERPKACPQEGFELGQPSTSEDCLYLNVTTPRHASGERLPVMVWLHGGSFKDGAGHLYGAQRLAAEGNAVVVTVNYRLGAFGFLAHPALDGPPGGARSGNYGLQDQQAALRWVQRNIAAFGGNAGNVTLFGESAGATAVCSQLAAPHSAGLFHRAIMQSSSCLNDWSRDHSSVPRPRAVAASQGRDIAQKLGCPGATPAAAECLRSRSVAQIRDASGEGEGLGPVYGTNFLPTQPKTAVETGTVHPVPILHGINRDEERFMLMGSHPHPVPAKDYRPELEQRFGNDAQAVMNTYPCHNTTDCRLALAAARTDANFAHPLATASTALSTQAPTYAYEYADPHAPGMQGLPPVGYPLGAYHTAELPSLFNLAWAEQLNAEQQRLARQMIGYWTRFARHSNPNGHDAPTWQPYNPSNHFVLQLAPGHGGIAPTDFHRRHHTAFWQSLTH